MTSLRALSLSLSSLPRALPRSLPPLLSVRPSFSSLLDFVFGVRGKGEEGEEAGAPLLSSAAPLFFLSVLERPLGRADGRSAAHPGALPPGRPRPGARTNAPGGGPHAATGDPDSRQTPGRARQRLQCEGPSPNRGELLGLGGHEGAGGGGPRGSRGPGGGREGPGEPRGVGEDHWEASGRYRMAAEVAALCRRPSFFWCRPVFAVKGVR